MSDKTVIENLVALLLKLERLLLSDPPAGQLEELKERHRAVRDQLERLTNASIDRDTEAYAQANEKLTEAVTELDDAIQRQAEVAEAIHKIAVAVELVARILART